MARMITDIEDYFAKGCGRCDRFDSDVCATRIWAKGIAALREVCLSSGLEETLRWGQPCYRHAGRNIALIGAFRHSFVLSFFNAALLQDADGVLVKPGPNSQHASVIRFTGAQEVRALRPSILANLVEARGHAAAGKTAPKSTPAPELPQELVEALDDDPHLAEAFHALTPGRQRSYVIALASAKKPATRRNRIARLRARILAGKGANEY